MTREEETSRSIYPAITPRRAALPALRKWTSRGLWASAVICAVVNLCVGGKPWVLLVGLGECLLYTAFLYKVSIEPMHLERVAAVMYMVCAILLVSDWWGSGAAETALPMAFFGMLLVCAIVCLVEYKRHRKNLLPPMGIFLVSVFVALLGLFMPWGLNWPRIVLLGTSVFLSLACFLLYRKIVITELKKRFSTR